MQLRVYSLQRLTHMLAHVKQVPIWNPLKIAFSNCIQSSVPALCLAVSARFATAPAQDPLLCVAAGHLKRCNLLTCVMACLLNFFIISWKSKSSFGTVTGGALGGALPRPRPAPGPDPRPGQATHASMHLAL